MIDELDPWPVLSNVRVRQDKLAAYRPPVDQATVIWAGVDQEQEFVDALLSQQGDANAT